MVAIVTGSGVGLERSSGFVLGANGQIGNAAQGRGGDNVFVNAATGNLVIQNRDEFVTGVGLDYAITRTYNSLGDASDDNADNWLPGLSSKVSNLTGTVNTSGSTVKRTSRDGSQVTYTWNTASSTYVATDGAGAYDTLTYASGIWTWTDGNSRFTEQYDNANSGRIINSKDTDGNTLTYTYTGTLLTRVTDQNGEYTDFAYTGTKLTSISTGSAAGTVVQVRYGYDSSNRLSTVTVDRTPQDGSISDNNTYVTTYTYSGSTTRVASITQTDGSSLVIAYDGSNRVQTLTQTAASGDTRVTSFSYTSSETTITDPAGSQIKLRWTANNQLDRITAPAAVSGGSTQVTTIAYNSNGDVTSVTDPSNNVTAYTYDTNGNVTLVRDAAGNTITRTYGTNNELLIEVRYLVPDPDGSGSGAASGGVATRYVYDAEMHLRFSVDTEGGVTEYAYDTTGQVTSVITYPAQRYNVGSLGLTTSLTETQLNDWVAGIPDKSSVQRVDTTYDVRGNVATVTSFSAADAAGAGLESKEYGRTTYTYDVAGNLLTRKTNGSSSQEVFTYDGLDRMITSVDLAGAQTTIAYLDSSTTTQVTLANGLVQASVYNKAGDLISYTVSGSDTVTSATTSKYDKNGNLRMVTDATGRTTYSLFDDRDKKTADIGPDGAIVEYRYDIKDRLIATISYFDKLTSTQISNLVDGSGNPADIAIATVRPAGNAGSNIWQWRIYDKADQLIETIDGTGAVTVFAYDGASRLAKITSYSNFLSAGTVSGFKTTLPTTQTLPTADANKDRVTRNFYDDDGRLVGVLDGSGGFSQIDYDASGLKIREIARGNFVAAAVRAAGTFEDVSASAGVNMTTDRQTDFVYDGRGLLRYVIDPAGKPTAYIYDVDGRLLRTTEYPVSIPEVSTYTLKYVEDQINGTPDTVIKPVAPPVPEGMSTVDTDKDGIINVRDIDIDGDGVVNAQDSDMDGDNIANNNDIDRDGDGKPDSSDPTPNGETDFDLDGILDSADDDNDNDGIVNASDTDRDNDGVLDSKDYDLDNDGIRNAADEDIDGDGLFDGTDPDRDGDGIANQQDSTPYGEPDLDGDGRIDINDNDRDGDGISNSQDSDADGDGVADASDFDRGSGDTLGLYIPPDPTPALANQDLDRDGVFDRRDYDLDGDGVVNTADNDIDGDGLLNTADLDIDGDGKLNSSDSLANGQPDFDGDGIADTSDTDIDGDGVVNASDFDRDNDGVIDRADYDLDGDGLVHPYDSDLDGDGIANVYDADIDNDGILNASDTNPNGEPDFDGDGIRDRWDEDMDGDGGRDRFRHRDQDRDGDNILDYADPDRGDGSLRGVYQAPPVYNPDIDADGVKNGSDLDVDGDGTPNWLDTDIDNDGMLANFDPDDDGDGILDAVDDSPKGGKDLSGDGVINALDVDLDKDGLVDSLDDDIDNDGIINSRDRDLDGDGTPNVYYTHDNSPNYYDVNYFDLDIDGDGIQNDYDDDRDGDGVENHPDENSYGISDIDGDGELDHEDDDRDGDGIYNDATIDGYQDPVTGEWVVIFYPADTDDDGDGILDTEDEDHGFAIGFVHREVDDDIDGDGALNYQDYDIDGDGILNSVDLDMDGDGLVNFVITEEFGEEFITVLDDSDADGDGILNYEEENFDLTWGVPDFDNDGIKNSSDSDRDGDGISNTNDTDDDGDGILDASDPDGGSGNTFGVAPTAPGPDMDADGIPDASDKDLDGDGLLNTKDIDIDGDGILNVSDGDIDGDGITNQFDLDIDGDGITNKRDATQFGEVDTDGDGTPDFADNDLDNDGVLNGRDYDLDGDWIRNSDDTDIDGDQLLNGNDPDKDGDGIFNANDSTPDGQPDFDGDGVADASDTDIDGDGILNSNDDDADGDRTNDRWDIDGGTNTSLGTSNTPPPIVIRGKPGISPATVRYSRSVYDAAGRLAFAIDPTGAVTRNTYDSVGTLIAVTRFKTIYSVGNNPGFADMVAWAANQSSGAQLTRFVYDVAGRLIYEVDAEGFVTEHQYDAAGRVTKDIRYAAHYAVTETTTKTSLAGQIGSLPGDAVVVNYTYDSAGRLTDVTDGVTGVTHYVYDGLGQVTDVTVGYGTADAATTRRTYDVLGRMLTEVKAYGATEVLTTAFTYDALGNVLTRTEASGTSESALTTYTYDTLGNVLTAVAQIDASTNATTSYQYDAFARIVKVTDPRNNARYRYYDEFGRLTLEIDAEGYATKTEYSAFGLVEKVTRVATKTSGAAVGTPPALSLGTSDHVTLFEYDKLDRLVKTIDSEGYYEQYTLDAFGNRVAVRNKLGATTTNTYDKRGLLISEKLPMSATSAAGTVVATTVTNNYEYDARGNRTKKIEAYGLTEQRTTTYTYDKLDRLTETRGDTVSVTDTVNFQSTTNVVPTEQFKYDLRGNVIEHVDANGARTLCFYDDLDRKIVELDALGTYTAYTYDKTGDVLTARVYATAVTLPTNPGGTPPSAPGGTWRETSYTYDKLDRMKTSSVAGLTTGAWNGSTYATATSQTATVTYDYDAAGNVIKVTDALSGAVFSYYDKLGRKTAEVDTLKYLTSWTYDAEGNVASERRYATAATGTINTSSPPSVSTNANDRVTNFTYDGNGRRLTEARTGVTAWTVNATTGVPTAASTTATITYTYNALGQVLTKAEATGDTTTYVYDSMGRLVTERRAMIQPYGGGNLQPSMDYYYDGLNNLTRTREGGARVTQYLYGAGGRLLSMTNAASEAFTYFYDAAGNRIRESYTRVLGSGGSATEGVVYTRDALGRVTSQAIAAWNGSAWVKGDTQDTEYSAFGEVSRRGVNGLWQEQFAYDGAGRLWRTNSGDGVWRYFIYDKNGNQTLTIESEGTDLSNKTIDQAITAATSGGSVGGAYIDGVNVTIGIFDARGLQTGTREQFRQLSSSTTQTLTYARAYNAFGEVTSETDARAYTTTYGYNTMGRVIQKVSPQVAWLGENGAGGTAAPTETFYYDLSGRLVGNVDANNNVVTRTLLAGSGYGGTEAQVTQEFYADGVARTYYNIFGDAQLIVDPLGNIENISYDSIGRVSAAEHRSGLIDYYTYDILGQRIQHWNGLLGGSNVEITDYDKQGRIVTQIAFGGDKVTTSYAWSSSIATSGMGTFGGWTQTTVYWLDTTNHKDLVEQSDVFGRDVAKTDLGGHSFAYGYDLAGRQVSNAGGETLKTDYYNTGLVAQTYNGNSYSDSSSSNSAAFTYDAAGNKLTETTERNSSVVQNATATYDALGRMLTWSEAGTTIAPAASSTWTYDLVGNIRKLDTSYKTLTADGAVDQTVSKTWWYRYDARNRLVIDKGTLSGTAGVGGTTIVASAGSFYDGTAYTYDSAGNRMTATRTTVLGTTVESYGYRGDGILLSVDIATNGGAAVRKADYTYDTMGRLTHQVDWIVAGSSAAYDRALTYNAKGQIDTDTATWLQAGDTMQTITTNSYTWGGSLYYLGSVVHTSSANKKNGSTQNTTETDSTYAWWDGVVQSTLTYHPVQATNWVSIYSYDAWGALISVDINDARERDVTFINDMNGQAIRRNESNPRTGNAAPHEVWYRFNGKEMGYTGNNNSQDVDYTTSIANRGIVPANGEYRYGATASTQATDFSQSLDPYNSNQQGASGGVYTVQAGDTLQSIALQVWGDASLWYKLAEANGMGDASGLIEGQQLILPVGIQKNTHNAGTLKPFDPAEAVGDTSPTRRKPAKKNSCGTFGAILLAAVAIAVAAVVAHFAIPAIAQVLAGAGAGAAATAAGSAAAIGGGIIGGAIGGAAGSLVSQGIGVATGLQDKFSWKSVALSALAGGVSGGIAGAGILNGGTFWAGAARGALSSALTQGIGVATGLQSKFDWASVAAAGIGAGVGNQIHLGGIGGRIVSNAAGGIAGAAVASLATGRDFGDTVLAALPGIIGNTIGGVVTDRLSRKPDQIIVTASKDVGQHVFDETVGLAAPGVTSAAASGTLVSVDGDATVAGYHRGFEDGPNITAGSSTSSGVAYVTAQSALAYGSATYNGQQLGMDPNARISAFLTGGDGNGWSLFQRLDIASQNYLDIPAGNEGSLSARVLAENAQNPWGLESVTAGLESAVSQYPVFAPALADDIRVLRNRVDAFNAVANPMANRAAWDLVSAGLNADALTAAHRMIVNREITWSNAITLGTSIVPVVGKAGGKVLSGTVRIAAESETLSPFTRRYLKESGGRWGGTATRQQNYALSQELKSRGYTVTEGGGIGPEEYIAGAGPGSKGGTFVDITSTAPNGRTVRIQTITTRTLPDGTVVPTASEAAAAARIRAAFPNDKLLLVPKR